MKRSGGVDARTVGLWVSLNGVPIGLPIAIVCTSAVLAAMLWALLPIGGPSPSTGTITAFGWAGARSPTRRQASVAVDGEVLRVTLPTVADCRLGDRVALQKWRVRTGTRYQVRPTPSPCSRP